jgi:predicted secreted protein
MQIGSIIAIYFVLWWLTFVAVLPIGSVSHHEAGTEVLSGSDPGAPVRPRLGFKALLATGLAGVFTALLMWGLTTPWLVAYWNR